MATSDPAGRSEHVEFVLAGHGREGCIRRNNLVVVGEPGLHVFQTVQVQNGRTQQFVEVSESIVGVSRQVDELPQHIGRVDNQLYDSVGL